MSYYEEKINRALEYLKNPRVLAPTGHKPIVYFVYNPKDAFCVSQMVTGFIRNKAEFLGFKPYFVSFGKALNDFITNNKDFNELWNSVDSSMEELLHRSIKQAIEQSHFFENEILRIQEELRAEPQNLIIITDVEMIHPYYLMGNFEANIYNKINLPILVLYPGEEQGTARSFLSIYNQDGSYRSLNF